MNASINNETIPQRIMVFQQNGSGKSKIKGVRQFGGKLFILDVFSIDDTLPAVIDDTHKYLPQNIRADIVLDFLMHPDLSLDLSRMCFENNIPMIASGKKIKNRWPHTPST